MPTPPDDGPFIEISDFSPGIYSDFHGAVSPRFTASDTLVSPLIGPPGIAQVDGTERCHADKTGALIPLPAAQPTGVRDTIAPTTTTTPLYRYVLDAQIGNTLVDATETEAAPFEQANRSLMQVMWGYWLNFGTGPAPTVIGREYRLWLDFPDDYSPTQLPMVDFLVGFADASPQDAALPAGSLCRARFYYGNTVNGKAEATAANTQNLYHPLWMYPVSVALAATPWIRWGAGNRWSIATTSPGVASYMGLAQDIYAPLQTTTPAIGWVARGTAQLAMSLNDNGVLDMPFPTEIDRWFFHYSERYVTPQTDLAVNLAEGMLNPYMVVAHQGRIVMPDRRRSAGGLASTSLAMDYGFVDDLLFYSDVHLPTQNFADPPLAVQNGIGNSAYGDWPEATMEPYNKLLVAEDSLSDIGTLGVVTIDQLLVVKHQHGGALISGDLDNPTIHRLPYIESTGGVICKGEHTAIGFVYGSPNGIFVWAGGDNTQKLSPQLDGFFWDHTDGSQAETYTGSRGRITDWGELIFVPNNYVYDIETQSWWRVAVQTLAPVSNVDAPYNCYDVDKDDLLYAWPYRHRVPVIPSSVVFPTGTTELNALSVPDLGFISSQLDVRFCIRLSSDLTSLRTILSQYQPTGDQRSWLVRLNTSNELELLTSTDGTAGTTLSATCSVPWPAFGPSSPILGRVTWRASDGRVQFFTKAIGSIKGEMRSDFGWTQLGTDEVAATAPLHNSTERVVTGNVGDDGLASPFSGRVFAMFVSATIDGPALYETYPDDIPEDTSVTSYTAESGQTITVTRAATPPSLSLVYVDPEVPPVWYTFDHDVLDTAYSWQSHPITVPGDRSNSIQNILMTATSASTTDDPPTVTVTVRGYNRTGDLQYTRTNTLTLALESQPQLLRDDIADNPVVDYITVQLEANDPNGRPAPKIHSVRLGIKPRARIPRHGN